MQVPERAHRVVDGPGTFKCGIAVGEYFRGKNVLISDESSARVEPVFALWPQTGWFRVVSFGLVETGRPTAHLIVVNDVVGHNVKNLGNQTITAEF